MPSILYHDRPSEEYGWPFLNCGLNGRLATVNVLACPGSVMVFYWRNPSGDNVSYLRSSPILTFPKLLTVLPNSFFFFLL